MVIFVTSRSSVNISLLCDVIAGLVMAMYTKATGTATSVVVMAVGSLAPPTPWEQPCTLENGWQTRDADMEYLMTS